MTVAAQRSPGATSKRTERPLLASKLAIPRTPGRVVARPRLFALLDTGVERPLTLGAAPAGSGKTILLTSWMSAASPPGPVAWLSLDCGDDDPDRFWTYVLAALCRSGAVPADSQLQALLPLRQADEALLPLIVHWLEDLDRPVILVLDDLHELTDAQVLQGIEFLVRHAPPQLRLVLLTRSDPPLPLHRLLVSGRLTQVRAADLAFTVAEAAELLAEYDYRDRLSDDDLTVLQARTEGWAAGLRLAAMSMQNQPDLHRFVMELAGDDWSLGGYLVSEVLAQLPAKLRDFLVRTSIVDQLSGELADALIGRDDGERILASLERANVFVMAVGSRRGWYRYHPLFAELLRYELRREAPQELPELRRRAARWYTGHGLPVDAVQQAVAMEDWSLAADLIAEHGFRPLFRGQQEVVRDLLARLPADASHLHPELAVLTAAERIAGNGAKASLQPVGEQARMVADDRRPRFALLLATCRLLRASRVGDLDEALAAGREALDAEAQLDGNATLDGVASDALTVVLSGLGAAELWTGESDVAEAHLRAGQVRALLAGLDEEQRNCLDHLALLAAVSGRLNDAVQTGQAALELAGSEVPTPWTALTLLALAWVHYQRDELSTANRYLDRAEEIAGAKPPRPLRVASSIIQGQLRQARGDLAGAFAALGAAHRDLSGWTGHRLLARWLAVTEVRLHLAAGDTGSAGALLREFEPDQPAPASEVVALARLQLATDYPEGAGRTIATLVDGSAPAPALVTNIEAWLVHALAGEALDKPEQVTASLGRAVELARPEEHRRVFLDAGVASRELLARYRERVDASWPFLDELAQAALDPRPTAVSPMPALIEPLSQREQAVLRYLPSMLTFVEIGSELYISVNTTKSHVRSIYRKLGVVGRRDAVRRARQLQLLRS
ncbi:MAG TPA: LuxR C-terminal-related transcriptional regulator [Propionibacteriaceae bacterium]|nr:LuxR C-terminal-related transcriptional regulator [Propionibacteriaceae bacterium]